MMLKMKIRKLILLGLIVLGLPAVGTAQFDYFINNGAITITGYTGTNKNVVIPDMIAGFPVTTINYFSTYYYYLGVTNITIPESVTNISSGAFGYQSQLAAIWVDPQNSYYSSTNGVLFDKNQFTLIQAPGAIEGNYVIPDTVTSIGDWAFDDCFNLSNVILPNGVTNIGAGAFESCGSLTNVTTGPNVKNINNNAFSYCSDLPGITVPDSVTNIGSGAFYGCSGLTNVGIGPNIIGLGEAAFAGCQNLQAINVDAQNSVYCSSNGVLFDKRQLTLIQMPGGMTGNYAVPIGVTSIGVEAFEFCQGLTNILVSDSVTNIGLEAFYGCSMTGLVLGTNLVGIGEYAFDDCYKLISVAVPNRVTGLETGAFQDCSSLSAVSLGDNLVSIGDGAFLGCSDLPQLVIPNSVTSIANDAFSYCSRLENLTLGTHVVVIGDNAFSNCGQLASIAIPESVTKIGGDVFSGCGSLSAIVVDGQNPVYASADGVLFNKSQTTLIQVPAQFVGIFNVPDSVLSISNGALAGCWQLTAITVGGQNSVFTSVNGVLFDKPVATLIQCPGAITGNYEVPYGVSSLDNTAFFGCTNLVSIFIPSSVTNVGATTFQNCPYTGIYFGGNAPSIGSPGSPFGIVLPPPFGAPAYDPNAEAVYYLPGTTGWSTYFDGLTAYLWNPPYVCTQSTNSITIDGFIGSGGTIDIPNTINGLPVTGIADGLFDDAASLSVTNVVLSTNLTSIGEYAFAACENLTSLTIPNSVTNLGSGVFLYCNNLTGIYFQGNAPTAGASEFFSWSGAGIGFPFFGPPYEPPNPTTVYYLPGTTGWSTNFAGQPVVLWNPQAQTGDGSFGVHAGGFGFNVTGSSNIVVVVEAITNLSGADWQPVQTITLPAGSAYFHDPQWTNYPGRFYRFRSP